MDRILDANEQNEEVFDTVFDNSALACGLPQKLSNG